MRLTVLAMNNVHYLSFDFEFDFDFLHIHINAFNRAGRLPVAVTPSVWLGCDRCLTHFLPAQQLDFLFWAALASCCAPDNLIPDLFG